MGQTGERLGCPRTSPTRRRSRRSPVSKNLQNQKLTRPIETYRAAPEQGAVSGFGQTRRFDRPPETSGLARSTDINRAARLVRFVPFAEFPEVLG